MVRIVSPSVHSHRHRYYIHLCEEPKNRHGADLRTVLRVSGRTVRVDLRQPVVRHNQSDDTVSRRQ